jgi:hypothetical protein
MYFPLHFLELNPIENLLKYRQTKLNKKKKITKPKIRKLELPKIAKTLIVSHNHSISNDAHKYT